MPRRRVGLPATGGLLAALVAGVLAAPPAAGWDCGPGPWDLAQRARQADAVFVGRVVDVRTAAPDEFFSDIDRTVYTFAVSRVYKGEPTLRQEVVKSSFWPVDGETFPPAVEHVVLATARGDGYDPAKPGQYFVHLCSGSGALDSSESLAALGPGRPPGAAVLPVAVTAPTDAPAALADHRRRPANGRGDRARRVAAPPS